MPNGYGKNWIRFCAAIEGFQARYGRWPSRVRIHELGFQELVDLLTPEEYAKILTKITIISVEEGVIAEDDSGGMYDYAKEGFSEAEFDIRAEDWLGVTPNPEYFS